MNPEKIRVFITVKTYPTLSAKYDELVCTAGITEKGNWIRIYPVPFRKLQWKNQYKKYQWIELDVIRNTDDFRPESHKPINRGQSINIKEKVEHWGDKKNIIFQETIFTNMKDLIANAKNQKTSLAIFKPKEIVDFKIEPTEREWDAQKIKQIEEESRQLNLFDSDQNSYEIFQRVKKLPYKFSYSFIDEEDTKSTLMIEDWELGALYWKYENEQEAIQKVKQKFFDELKQKDLYLFLGTTKKFHNISPNPFIIIGVFYPPLTNQMSLL
ncbi:MAG: hypothetical protein OXK80_02415 [Bdellovibrionales bacterium]|nr:hypothetical protein [Bdellovibrionales bacterium]